MCTEKQIFIKKKKNRQSIDLLHELELKRLSMNWKQTDFLVKKKFQEQRSVK